MVKLETPYAYTRGSEHPARGPIGKVSEHSVWNFYMTGTKLNWVLRQKGEIWIDENRQIISLTGMGAGIGMSPNPNETPNAWWVVFFFFRIFRSDTRSINRFCLPYTITYILYYRKRRAYYNAILGRNKFHRLYWYNSFYYIVADQPTVYLLNPLYSYCLIIFYNQYDFL